jgi:tRNA uridine 5-carboxymethylaminomethyl modification enzyme
LSIEEKEKLALARPASIGMASRIPGITPYAILSLLRFVKKQRQQLTATN